MPVIDCRVGDVSEEDVGLLLTPDQARVIRDVLGNCSGPGRNGMACHLYDVLYAWDDSYSPRSDIEGTLIFKE